MNRDTFGLARKETKTDVKKMSNYIEIEKEIEKKLNMINQEIEKIYTSYNSSNINKNNEYLLEAIHTKRKNLESYKLYTEKYIENYSNATKKAKKISKIA